MVTREEVLAHIAAYESCDGSDSLEWHIESLRLALAHLDSERARRVGEAVIASGITAEKCEMQAREYRNAIGSLRLSYSAGGRSLKCFVTMLDGVAAALRGEP